MKSMVLTSVQFFCLGWIVYSNPWLANQPVWVVIQFLGLTLGIWAIFEMSKSKLNITPRPRDGSVLITSGPYRIIRHPMYTALILTFFPILARDHGLLNLIVFGILLVNLIFKLSYEERLLRDKFSAYDEMRSRTWRLCPWIY